MFNYFKKFLSSKKDQSSDVVKNLDWNNERYDLALVQRNILFLVLILFIVLSMIAIFALLHITNNVEIKPFIIQVDNDTGKVIVLKDSNNSISQNDSLAQFFLKQYVSARETYNSADFTDIALNKVRLFSTSSVYNQFLGYIKNPDINPTIKYGNENSTYMTIKSWSKISNNSYIVRFSINETTGNMKQFNKISVIKFEYIEKELTENELSVNPVGFTVTSYRVDDDEI
ncbi:MAG: virB8 family protein [Rickettsia sp.]|nr:virB8 family protein [Rickettsia sp.]